MKCRMVFGMVLAFSLLMFGCATEQQATKRRSAPMTMADITAMTKAGISDSVIVAMLSASRTHFSLNAQDVIALTDSGVSETVISALLKPGEDTRQEGRLYAAYPWYARYGYPYIWYDPFWGPGYYPRHAVRLGFYGGFGGHVGHRGGGRR